MDIQTLIKALGDPHEFHKGGVSFDDCFKLMDEAAGVLMGISDRLRQASENRIRDHMQAVNQEDMHDPTSWVTDLSYWEGRRDEALSDLEALGIDGAQISAEIEAKLSPLYDGLEIPELYAGTPVCLKQDHYSSTWGLFSAGMCGTVLEISTSNGVNVMFYGYETYPYERNAWIPAWKLERNLRSEGEE